MHNPSVRSSSEHREKVLEQAHKYLSHTTSCFVCRSRRENGAKHDTGATNGARSTDSTVATPAKLFRSRRKVARPKGFEPLTPRFVVWCSIQLSYGRAVDRGNVFRAGRERCLEAPLALGKPSRVGCTDSPSSRWDTRRDRPDRSKIGCLRVVDFRCRAPSGYDARQSATPAFSASARAAKAA